jgi:anti-sigma factor RsiW
MVARNSAVGAVTALLIGLMGSLIGGWLASGEPMSLTYRRMKEDDDVSGRRRARAA